MASKPSPNLPRKPGPMSSGPGPLPSSENAAGPGAAAVPKHREPDVMLWKDDHDTQGVEQSQEAPTGPGQGQTHWYAPHPQSTLSYPSTLRTELSIPQIVNVASSQDSGSGVTGATRRNRGPSNRQRNLSEGYFGETSINVRNPRPFVNPMTESLTRSVPTTEEVKTFKTKQSRRLPYWVWFILAKSLGIKLHEFDKPWFGTLMYLLTVLFALGYLMLHVWYTVYDINSIRTNQTILTGLISIMIVTYFCALGPYSNKLAGKLFTSQKFVESVRLHSRTIFKISSAGILILLGFAVMTLNLYNASQTVSDSYCAQNVTVSVTVCRAMYGMRVGYSVFCLLWNLLVGIVLLSVCRTHTIGIRRFIRQLEEDGRLYEMLRQTLFLQERNSDNTTREEIMDSSDDLDDQFVWDDHDISPIVEDYQAFQRPVLGPMSPGAPHTPTRRSANFESTPIIPPSPKLTKRPHPPPPKEMVDFPIDNTQSETNGAAGPHTSAVSAHQVAARLENRPIIVIKEGSVANSEEIEKISMESDHGEAGVTAPTQRLINPDPPSQASRSTRSLLDSPQNSLRVELSSPRRIPSSICGSSDDRSSDDNLSVIPRILTPDEILLNYWRISCRLRSTGMALQRWLIAWVMFVLIWSATFLVYWIKNEARLLDIAEFVLPILLLPLLCSAYGEVNNEGKKMVLCVCPMEERMNMLQFLQFQPLQLTAFGFPVSYSAILTVLGALALGFCTRIVLDEFKFD